MSDVFELTAQLVDIASPSFHEAEIVDWLESKLSSLPHLELTRIGDNLVARSDFGRTHRVVLAGHTDTVPANGNDGARIDGDVLWGVGSADMKGGLAVMLDAATRHSSPAVDATYVFYAREEVAAVHSGLGELMVDRPDLLAGDLALIGEPTDAAIEAGCQGTMRVRVRLGGARAHTARAWMGRNAVHRLAPLLADLAAYEPRRPVVDGCEYHEAMLAVAVEGGVSGNVVPDSAVVTIGHRFAPDRSIDEAFAEVRRVVDPHLVDGHDEVELVDAARAAPPGIGHPLLAQLISRHSLEVRAKLGWTDVARFAELGIPAANFGPGDPTIAHTAGEHVCRASVERAAAVIDDLLSAGLDA